MEGFWAEANKKEKNNSPSMKASETKVYIGKKNTFLISVGLEFTPPDKTQKERCRKWGGFDLYEWPRTNNQPNAKLIQ